MLWVQYFGMITIIKKFIQVERSGDWLLHLNSMQRMIPYFRASRHFLYAKSGHIYLQDMLYLTKKAKENPLDYELRQFTKEGFFTIRRSDKFWCEISSEMTIEQYLMRQIKSTGGLIHGRGIYETVLSEWILKTAYCLRYCRVNYIF